MDKIYGLRFDYTNNGRYDDVFDDRYIEFYSSKEIALKHFNNLDPEELFFEYTACMNATSIEEYTVKTDINEDGLPIKEFNAGPGGWFCYQLLEIDVIND